MWNDRSVKRSVEVPPVSCVFRCRMWHVSGVIFVECFLFPFLPYSHSMCIYCVISIHIRYFPVYVWLLVMYHWLSVPNNGKSALFALRPVYACTSHVQQPLYCFWCVSSSVTVTDTGSSQPSANPKKIYILWQHYQTRCYICEKSGTFWFRNKPCSFTK